MTTEYDMSAKKALGDTAKAALGVVAQLPHAKIQPHRSSTRGHADHGWLSTYHSFSFANWYNPKFMRFGSLRVLNEDTVQPEEGFPTHPHRDFEIFSYVLSGELTHRDSMLSRGHESEAKESDFFRVRRGDVQFTTGGTGISHSEFNERTDVPVHFLQIWAMPWARGLKPAYHNKHFSEEAKRANGGTFVPILSPLKAGPQASEAEETAAEPAVPGTIPVHADFAMGAAIVAPNKAATWTVGLGAAGTITQAANRKVFVHLPMTNTNRALGQPKANGAKIRLAGRTTPDAVLSEGDGAFVDAVVAGDQLTVENIGTEDAEVIVLDTTDN